jgi:thiamine-phosphate diphosphorylase
MLQFITSGKGDVACEVASALKGGCRWIQLSMPGDAEALKAAVEQIIPMCTENEAFLVIDDAVELVDELKVHGVFLNDSSRATVSGARERLGAHAIIGVLCKTIEEIVELRAADIDYVEVPAPATCDAAAFYTSLHTRMKETNTPIHLVARGEFEPAAIPVLIAAGCAGVAMSSAIINATDSSAKIAEVLDALDLGLQQAGKEKL